MPDAPVVQPGTDASATAAGGDGAPKYADAAQVTALQEGLSKLTTHFNYLSAELRKAQKASQTQTPEVDGGRSGEDAALSLKSLQSQMKAELDARDMKIRSKAVDTEITSFCSQAQIPKGLQPFFKAYVKEQYLSPDSKIKLTTNQQDEVGFEDELGEWKPFEVLGKKILSTADGATFLPASMTPGQVGQRTAYGY